MNDLISRETAIEEIYFECYESTCDDEYGQGYNDGLRKSIHKLKYLPTIEPEPAQRWIPVEERVPEDGEYVLVCADKIKSAFGPEDCRFLWRWISGYSEKRVSAWMPLPEPYTTQSNDSKALDALGKGEQP